MKSRWFLLFGILFMLTQCKREATTWDVDLLFPVAEGRISIIDLIPDTLLEVDADGVTHLVYESNILNLEIDSLVSIPDTSIRESFVFPVPGGPFSLDPGFEVVSLEETFNFEMDDVQLREVLVKSGSLYYIAKNYINGQLLLNYEIPGVTKDGESFVINAVMDAGMSTIPSVLEGEIDLSGYHMNLTGSDGLFFNQLVSLTSVSVDPNASGPALVFGGDSVNIELFFLSPSIDYAKGYFGQQTTIVDDTSRFEGLSSLISGGLTLNDISIDVTLVNYVGADATVVLDQIKAMNSDAGTSVSLTHPEMGESINITRAFDNNGVVEPTTYSFGLSTDNSNILNFIQIIPDELAIKGEFQLNPLGNVSAANDFIYSDRPIEAIVNLDIPLCINLDQFSLKDTLAIDFEQQLDASGIVTIYILNGFPFSADIDIQIITQESISVASLVTSSTLGAGTLVGDEILATESVIQLQLTEEDVQELNSSNQLVVTVVFDTEGLEAKLSAEQFLDVRIVADVKGEIGYD